MGADVKPRINDAIGIRLQRAADAWAALAGRLVAGWTIALRTRRRWQRGIVGVLRRSFEHGQSLLQFR